VLVEPPTTKGHGDRLKGASLFYILNLSVEQATLQRGCNAQASMCNHQLKYPPKYPQYLAKITSLSLHPFGCLWSSSSAT
jgi:hypothetical protein